MLTIAVLKLEQASKSPWEGLLKHSSLGPTPGFSESVSLGGA